MAVGGLDDDAAAEMKPARRVRMASSSGVFVMMVLVLCVVVVAAVGCGCLGQRTPDT